MIIPSIDIQSGQVVQLIGGRELALSAGDPEPILKRFRVAGEVAVIDLDAALGRGENSELIKPLLRQGSIRVGGGIRSKERALEWLDAGAEKIILGSAANPELLKLLPKERVIAAVDARNGEVVVEGWERATGVSIAQKIIELKNYVSGFLVTFVESEGRLQGIDLKRVEEVVKLADPVRITVAGGVTTLEELQAIHKMGADAQVGMALYTGKINLGDAIGCLLPQDQLWPTVVCNQRAEALGLVYSDSESLRIAVDELRGVYHSRKRGLWRKGESSGAIQELLKVELDCDSDSLRFIVNQQGPGFCHTGSLSCWGTGSQLTELERTLNSRRTSAPEGSYSARLFSEPELLNSKLLEEAAELVAAKNSGEILHEAADLTYFTFAKLTAAGLSLADLEEELRYRSLQVSRRPGNAKAVL